MGLYSRTVGFRQDKLLLKVVNYLGTILLKLALFYIDSPRRAILKTRASLLGEPPGFIILGVREGTEVFWQHNEPLMDALRTTY